MKDNSMAEGATTVAILLIIVSVLCFTLNSCKDPYEKIEVVAFNDNGSIEYTVEFLNDDFMYCSKNNLGVRRMYSDFVKHKSTVNFPQLDSYSGEPSDIIMSCSDMYYFLKERGVKVTTDIIFEEGSNE
jgi:hypothetical protein